MNNKTFEDIVDNRFEVCKNTLFKKAKEYSSDDDRLHNFMMAAQINGDTPAQALWGMYTKHLVSIMDMVAYGNVSPEMIEEKFTDVINYMLLLEAIMVEEMEC